MNSTTLVRIGYLFGRVDLRRRGKLPGQVEPVHHFLDVALRVASWG
ncbi:hypothetical protein [Streptomyces sp. NPDC060065]